MPGRYWLGGWCTPLGAEARAVRIFPDRHTPERPGPPKAPSERTEEAGPHLSSPVSLYRFLRSAVEVYRGATPYLIIVATILDRPLQTDALRLSWVNVEDAGWTTGGTLGHDAYFWVIKYLEGR